MKYLWESIWYKVSVQEKDGKVSGRAEWDDHGRFREFDFPPQRIKTTGPVYEQMTARNVYAKLFYQVSKDGADVGRMFGPLRGFNLARVINDHGQGILI